MEPPRQPRDLQGLLKFALQGTKNEDPTTMTPMSEERKQWLEEALKGMSVNIVDELTSALRTLNPERLQNLEEDPKAMEEALEIITDYVDSIDTANDFHKIGGFFVLIPCLNSPHPSIRWRCGELIATISQNNPYCQTHLLSEGVLPVLLKIVENDVDNQSRIKALYAVSCLIRENAQAQTAFINCDGFSSLLRALQTSVEKLRVKAAFLLTCLCNENPAFKDTLCKMGFVEQFVALLQREHDSTHEHLLSALLALTEGHQAAIVECKRSEFQLKELLNKRLELITGQEEFQEEADFCRALLSLIFADEPVVEDR